VSQTDRRAAAWLSAIFAAIVLCIAAQTALRPHASLFDAVGLDFRAFYCSGEAVAHGANPYTVEPLRACEHRVQWGAGWPKDLAIPSPLPAYDLALLAVLAHLPYEAAKAVWFLVLLASMFLGAWFLTRLTRLPLALVLLCVLGGSGILCLLYGQLPPIVVGALAAGAYLLSRGRFALGAVALTCAMIEPHLGIAACLSAFLWIPRTRIAFACSFAVLAVAGVVATGLPEAIAYFTTVLPAQATAELVATDQYSLSHLLHVFGLPDRAALLLGSASYVAMLLLALWLARRATTATGNVAFVPLLPAAIVLFAGSFIHEEQFMAAVPAALLAASVSRRAAAWLALALLSFSWGSFSNVRHASDLAFVLLSLVAVAWIAALAVPRRAQVAALGAAVAFVVAVGFVRVLPTVRDADPDPPFPAAVTAAAAPATANWAFYLRSSPSLDVPSLRDEAAKIPAWIAIVLLALAAGTQLDGEQKANAERRAA
jgi:hypothetical protein